MGKNIPFSLEEVISKALKEDTSVERIIDNITEIIYPDFQKAVEQEVRRQMMLKSK